MCLHPSDPRRQLLKFPRYSSPAVVLPFDRSPAAPAVGEVTLSQAEIERYVALGRRLHGAAVRAALGRVFRHLVGGCSLRGLRLSGQRQPCC